MDRAQKRDTSLRIWRIAVELFVERGFGKVSVTEIAEAADVSKMTVFNYFGNKEDMVLKPMEGHTEDMARAVRERPQVSPPWRPCTVSSSTSWQPTTRPSG